LEICCCCFSFILLLQFQLLLFTTYFFDNIDSWVCSRVMSQLLKSYWYSCAPIMSKYKYGLLLPTKISVIPYTCGYQPPPIFLQFPTNPYPINPVHNAFLSLGERGTQEILGRARSETLLLLPPLGLDFGRSSHVAPRKRTLAVHLSITP
jgi:hypothetical protein